MVPRPLPLPLPCLLLCLLVQVQVQHQTAPAEPAAREPLLLPALPQQQALPQLKSKPAGWMHHWRPDCHAGCPPRWRSAAPAWLATQWLSELRKQPALHTAELGRWHLLLLLLLLLLLALLLSTAAAAVRTPDRTVLAQQVVPPLPLAQLLLWRRLLRSLAAHPPGCLGLLLLRPAPKRHWLPLPLPSSPFAHPDCTSQRHQTGLQYNDARHAVTEAGNA
jgi:hypothetical protein